VRGSVASTERALLGQLEDILDGKYVVRLGKS